MRPSNLVRRIEERRTSYERLRRPPAIAAVRMGVVAVVLAAALPSAASAAVPGLERVVMASESDTFAVKFQSARCPSGKLLLSSGGDITGGLGAVTMGLRPGPVNTSVVAVENRVGTFADWFIRAYSICADPLPGLQIVQVDGPSNSKDNKHITAACPPGKRLVGAGGDTPRNNVDQIVNGLIPNPELTKVIVRGAERDRTTDDWFVRAYAVCANPLPGLELVARASALDSTSSKVARATCPADKALVGLSGWISGGLPIAGQVVLDDLTPNAQLSGVTVTGREDQDGTAGDWRAHAYAICATA